MLGGDGVCRLDDATFPLRRGSVLARPAGTGVAHSFAAGADGLTLLAYGQRVPHDMCWYPRSRKLGFRAFPAALPRGRCARLLGRGAGMNDVNRTYWDAMAAVHGEGARRLLRRRRARRGDARAAAGRGGGGARGRRRRGRDVLHLQCHLGFDAVTLARRGARVVGADFSPAALEKARAIAARAGVEVEYVEADATALPASLHDRFDLVYATIGVLGWIGDLDAWMRRSPRALRRGRPARARRAPPALPGGRLARPARRWTSRTPTRAPQQFDEDGSYADSDAKLAATRTDRARPLARRGRHGRARRRAARRGAARAPRGRARPARRPARPRGRRAAPAAPRRHAGAGAVHARRVEAVTELLGKRLIFVTGKGGVGKTAVAAALGMVRRAAGPADDRGRGRAARRRAPGAGGQRRRVAASRRSATGSTRCRSTRERAMEEYLDDQLASPLSDLLVRLAALHLPRGRDAGDARAARPSASSGSSPRTERRTPGAEPYDLVVVDAPATGHGLALLDAPRTFGEVAAAGPVARQARTIDATLARPVGRPASSRSRRPRRCRSTRSRTCARARRPPGPRRRQRAAARPVHGRGGLGARAARDRARRRPCRPRRPPPRP